VRGLLGSDEVADSDDTPTTSSVETRRELGALRAALQEAQRRVHELEEECERAIALERSARAEAERANRLKDQFLAVVAHELRAPVTTLLLWERVLREEALDEEARARALDAIRESATQQARLVADLLDMSRALYRKLRVELQPVALDALLEAAVENARVNARPKELVVAHVVEPGLGDVNADPGRLRQILDNLLSNAIKFTPRGGRITVTAACEGSEVVIAVSDTGCGIEPALLAQVFEPFSQGGAPTSREGGLGLGLAIARELVTLHGGSLRAFSDGPDRGARFELRLPRSHDRGRAATSSTELRDRLRDLSVLLVDDDVRVLSALRTLLERAGARVECTSSTVAAWSALHERRFDVVLCDLAMPVEDGYALVRRVRDMGGTARRIPVIALTACATPADRERALAAGVDLHVAKPVDAESLIASIASIAGVLAETS
jgi:signal transduction histidine kinase/ActR/RegA family two-component response regulator